MKVLLMTTNARGYALRRMVEEAEKMGVMAVPVEYQDLRISIDGEGVEILVDGVNVLEFDAVILRSALLSKYPHYDFTFQRQLVADYCLNNNKTVLNGRLMRNYLGGFDKLVQMVKLKQAGIPVVSSRYYGNLAMALEEEKAYAYPKVMKSLVGSHGFGVRKLKSERDMKYYAAAMMAWKSVFQPFLPAGEDYRVIVLGGRVLGAMKKKANKGSFLTNVSAGGGFEAARVTKELEELAVTSTKVFEMDFCGVDIMYDEDNKPLVLEMNDAAQFRGFETCTGLNVARELVNYVMRQARSWQKS